MEESKLIDLTQDDTQISTHDLDNGNFVVIIGNQSYRLNPEQFRKLHNNITTTYTEVLIKTNKIFNEGE